MPRRRRIGTGGLVFHVLNRGAKRTRLFETSADFKAFEHLLFESVDRVQILLLAYCLMPNHWHLILSPQQDGSLSQFMKRLAGIHALRWNSFRGQPGLGAVYQGRFKAIPIQRDDHFLRVCRYVERNPLRAGLVRDVSDWRWSSLWHRTHDGEQVPLSPWPVDRPANWVGLLQHEPEADAQEVRRATERGAPYGAPEWCSETATRLGIAFPQRQKGRPLKGGIEKSTRPLFQP
jgi:putative transposase